MDASLFAKRPPRSSTRDAPDARATPPSPAVGFPLASTLSRSAAPRPETTTGVVCLPVTLRFFSASAPPTTEKRRSGSAQPSEAPQAPHVAGQHASMESP